jgi:hypothetical protein
MLRDPLTTPAYAYAPDANRAARRAPGQPPEWLVHWLAVLIFFLLDPLKATRLLRSGRLRQSWWNDRPDLPLASAQAEAASVRGAFGNSIRWLCLRHGIGPGHPDWPELSRAIVAFGGSLEGFRAGAPPCGLQWWENPGVVPGIDTSFSVPSAATIALARLQAAANAPPPAGNVMQAEAAHARSPASWLSAPWRQVFARAGPCTSTGQPGSRGPRNTVTTEERGQDMACPAVLIRAD